jgi:prolyl-tRNA synthetase
MRYSKLFGKTSKTVSADAESVNAKLLTQGGFIHQQMAGVYNYLPLGLRVLTKIQNIIREELNTSGAQEILMPALTQEENYVTTGRQGIDVLFHLEGAGGSKLVLNPTHEEIVTPLVKSYTFSYKDLPVAVYQLQNKFRNEARAKSGLLRGREFAMKDLYSFHTSTEDLEQYYQIMRKVYENIYTRLGLGEQTFYTYASGGDFTRYSHEFQTVSEVGEDTIYVCEKCRIAVNKEIRADVSNCPECGNADLVEKKAIEVGNIFKLQARFTNAFEFKYTDTEGKLQQVEMGCYGIGPSRIMGTIVELFNDEKGILWPATVAPYHIHLIQIGTDDEVKMQAEKLYQELLDKKVEVLFDDREGATAGEKFADADLIGIPIRIVISKKTLQEKSVEFKKRITGSEARLVKLDEIVEMLFSISEFFKTVKVIPQISSDELRKLTI